MDENVYYESTLDQWVDASTGNVIDPGFDYTPSPEGDTPIQLGGPTDDAPTVPDAAPTTPTGYTGTIQELEADGNGGVSSEGYTYSPSVLEQISNTVGGLLSKGGTGLEKALGAMTDKDGKLTQVGQMALMVGLSGLSNMSQAKALKEREDAAYDRKTADAAATRSRMGNPGDVAQALGVVPRTSEGLLAAIGSRRPQAQAQAQSPFAPQQIQVTPEQAAYQQALLAQQQANRTDTGLLSAIQRQVA